MNLKKMLLDDAVRPYILKARYGIEKESQRVDLLGDLSKKEHPKSISNIDNHPYIQRDFAETQMELITPVLNTLDELFNYLGGIHSVAYSLIGKDEMIWPLSMPPELPKEEGDILVAQFKNSDEVKYREQLGEIYGRRKQMISGVHYNFQFADELMEELFKVQSEIKDYKDFKTEVYLKVARNYLHYRWLVTYFYGASPKSENNFFEEDFPYEAIRSIRNSRYGYTNNKSVKVSYSSIDKYILDISTMVKEGILSKEKEFYSPVRLRYGSKVSDLKEYGIKYIELRNVDLNPFEMNGISHEQAEFLHLFLIYLLWKEEGKDSDEWVEEGNYYNDVVSLEHPLSVTKFQLEAEKIIDEMENLVEILDLSFSENLFINLREMLKSPSKTLAGKLYEEIEKSSQYEVARTIAKENYEKIWSKPYELAGFSDMELSTQSLMANAIKYGIGLEILDRKDQFLKLKLGNHIEYVKNGNMTSKDNYVSTLIMENKTVTKKILKENGFSVPNGEEFDYEEKALKYYNMFSQKPFVIKPKTTNYGLGISIFKEKASYEDYKKAVNLAFKEDNSILIEEFIEGTEYRFFVLNNEVKAVLLRRPANIVGDGKSTIEELVNEKNKDLLRGEDHRTPLEKIKLGEIEKLMLKGQNYEINSIPKKDEIIYLRENSNISTGGDSIDMTDEFTEDYKKIAVDAVNALGAKISGIDLIIKDKNEPAKNKDAYGIIEANFNPSMYMHIYPYKGKSRELTKEIIYYLFPEVL